METANIILALGEDMANTVPKRGVTPAEVAVLMAIHGENAVSEIDVNGETDKKPREVMQDLTYRYGRATDNENRPIIRRVFPATNSPMPKSFADMDLPDDYFKGAAPSVEEEDEEEGEKSVDDMTKTELVAYAEANDIEVDAKAKKSEILAAIEAAETDGASDDNPLG